MNNQTLKKKKKVNFGNLRVFYFYRAQGFDTIPMTGSISLGMEMKHYDCKEYSFNEYNKATSRENSLKYASWRSAAKSNTNSKLLKSNSKLFLQTASLDEIPTKSSSSISSENCINSITSSQCSLATDTEDDDQKDFENDLLISFPSNVNESTKKEEIEKNNSNNFANLCTERNLQDNYDYSSSSISTDEDCGFEFDDLECFLKPITGKLRKKILKDSGIIIDKLSQKETKEISKSRLSCGCSCLNGKCLPESCECSLSGIKCQVDRPFFPCTCSNECQNPEGRNEYNYIKVRSHWFQTIVRMKVIQSKGLENSLLGRLPQRIKFGKESNEGPTTITE